MPKVSEAHKDQVRRRLLDAAYVCLERNGFQDMTTRELLAEAGLSNGTLYKYFPSKEHIYEALAEELLGEDVERLRAEAGAGAPGGLGMGLLRFIREVVLIDPDAAIAVSTFRGRVTGDDAMAAIRRLNHWLVEQFAPLVDDAKADGWVRDGVDAEALVELIDLVWDGLGRRTAQKSFVTSDTRVGDVLIDLLIHGTLSASIDPADLPPPDPTLSRSRMRPPRPPAATSPSNPDQPARE